MVALPRDQHVCGQNATIATIYEARVVEHTTKAGALGAPALEFCLGHAPSAEIQVRPSRNRRWARSDQNGGFREPARSEHSSP
jgi:hypothetical protein